MTGGPVIAVVIPTRDNVEELLGCLASVRDLAFPKDRLELVVFDNGSTDGTGERVHAAVRGWGAEGWRRVAVERSPRNLGAFGGRAAAVDALGPAAELVLSLDDDVLLAPDALGRLCEAMAPPDVGVVGARIVYHDAPADTASGAGYFHRWLGTYGEAMPAGRAPCDFVTSCGCLIRRAALVAAGGFDRDYFTSHGDVDVCLKIRAGGYRVLYEPAAVIRHRVARGGTRTPERLYYGYRNKLLLLRKHLPAWWFPVVLAGYGALGFPKALGAALARGRRGDRAELRAIALALMDAVLDRRGEARWFPGPKSSRASA
jgi:GT2 family glycosyltransferase